MQVRRTWQLDCSLYYTVFLTQGYVSELILTLEAVVEALDSDIRPMDHNRDIFKSTPNLKDAVGGTGGVAGGGGGGVAMTGAVARKAHLAAAQAQQQQQMQYQQQQQQPAGEQQVMSPSGHGYEDTITRGSRIVFLY